LAIVIALSAFIFTSAHAKSRTQTSGAESTAHKTTHNKRPLNGPSRNALVGNIVNENIYLGCGCFFQFKSELRARSNLRFFVTDQSKRAWMNIAGEEVELRLTGADHVSLRLKKRERMDFRFEAGDVRVRLRMLVTRTSTYEADYEPARYAITVDVAKGKLRQTVRTIGSCGC